MPFIAYKNKCKLNANSGSIGLSEFFCTFAGERTIHFYNHIYLKPNYHYVTTMFKQESVA